MAINSRIDSDAKLNVSVLECIKTKAEAAIGGNPIDCADLALTTLAECCEGRIKLSLEVYDASTREYTRIKRGSYTSKEAFISDVKSKMGAISLFDQTKVTIQKELNSLVPGELILYDLRGQGGAYTGHTMILLKNDPSNKKVEVAEGHLSDQPPTRGTYAYKDLPNKFENSVYIGGRGWNWENITDSQ